jgi:hypothetical protein
VREPSRVCDACGRALPPSQVYFRFAVAIEGELDVLDTGHPDAADPRAILASMEDVSAEEAEGEVHWERSGALCGACRRQLLAFLGAGAGPH